MAQRADPPVDDPSLWQATASSPPSTPALSGNVSTDVAIIGAGYTGLSTALHLAEAGVEAIVIDRQGPGWGASGRNGGMVIPGLKEDPDDLIAKYGPETGDMLVRTSAATADLVFGLIERHRIDCDARREGWIQAAHTPKMLATLQRRFRQWQARGAAADWLDRAAMTARVGGDHYHGGWIDKRAGGLQPLSYAYGLARAAMANGATIHGDTPAQAIERSADGWRVMTPGGTIDADSVVIATNGYTPKLWPGLAQSVIPVISAQVATAPLSANLRGLVLADGEMLSDTRRVLWYFRQDAHGRLLMGGGGTAFAGGTPKLYDALRDRIRHLLPEAGDLTFEFAWNGRVALTTDHLPHLHQPAPGLWMGLGFNGRGVGMATMMGKVLADKVRGAANPQHDLPAQPIRALPLHGLRGIAITATRHYYRLRDALDG